MTSLTSYGLLMAITYSVYEAKARFSEVLRQVRDGKTVTVSFRGEPVAEIRAIKKQRSPTLDERLAELERNGCLVHATVPRNSIGPIERRPGALARFLEARDE